MATDPKLQTELDVLIAADRWARDILRTDKILNIGEQQLLDAVILYQHFIHTNINYHNFVTLPKPPLLPEDMMEPLADTVRYSKYPTIPSNPVSSQSADIKEELDELFKDFEET